MSQRMRALACLLVLASAFAAPGRLSAQSGGGAGAMDLSLGDVCQIAGGAVALGFGLWHFAVPSLHGWQSYVPDAPQSLVDAVAATNFFLVKPQGTHNPLLQWGMTGAFVVTDLLFLVAALDATW